MPTSSGSLALVPVWAVRDHDQIRARFDADRAGDLVETLGRDDSRITIRRNRNATLVLDGQSLTVTADGSRLPLGTQGFMMLEHLVRTERIVPADELMSVVWGSAHAGAASTLRALVHHVRTSLPASWSPSLTTVRRQGYHWTVDR